MLEEETHPRLGSASPRLRRRLVLGLAVVGLVMGAPSIARAEVFVTPVVSYGVRVHAPGEGASANAAVGVSWLLADRHSLGFRVAAGGGATFKQSDRNLAYYGSASFEYLVYGGSDTGTARPYVGGDFGLAFGGFHSHSRSPYPFIGGQFFAALGLLYNIEGGPDLVIDVRGGVVVGQWVSIAGVAALGLGLRI